MNGDTKEDECREMKCDTKRKQWRVRQASRGTEKRQTKGGDQTEVNVEPYNTFLKARFPAESLCICRAEPPLACHVFTSQHRL